MKRPKPRFHSSGDSKVAQSSEMLIVEGLKMSFSYICLLPIQHKEDCAILIIDLITGYTIAIVYMSIP